DVDLNFGPFCAGAARTGQQLVRDVFNHYGFDYYDPESKAAQSYRLKTWLKAHPGLAGAETEHVLLRQYVNSMKKMISQTPRKTSVSSKVTASSVPNSNKLAATAIQRKLEQGADVNPYLSKGLFVAYEEDQLLYSWRIYHFHLNDDQTKHSFFKDRSDWLLMALVEYEAAYLLDIREHVEKDEEGANNVWSRQELISILTGEFSDVAKKYRLNGLLPPESQLSDSEVRKMRKAGVNVIPSSGEDMLALGAGIATDDSSMEATMHTDQMMQMIYSWEKYLNEKIEDINADFEKQGLKTTKMQFKLGLDEDGFFVYEASTNARLRGLCQKQYFNPTN
ncbi:MAG TPA: hypothetical protein PKC28_03620, partial [Bdellovibrionales bacterium]|nr:hypothetical protein [Bdellovibrionales bacterium]